MQIKIINGKRVLIKDSEIVNIDDGDIITYPGIYYKTVNDIVHKAQIQTMFIGKVETYRSDTTGITGIYVEPLYIWNELTYEWNKIANYSKPTTKYFEYPHLLMIPDNYYCGPYSLEVLDSITNTDSTVYENVTTLFNI
jgi:hypothetical protein